MLRELVLLLEPFKVTTELFKKSAETVGLVIPCIMEMRKRSSCDPILNKQAHLITTKECKVIAATLHSSLVKRMAGFLSENFHILGKTILKFKFILGNELVFLTGTVISPQFKLKRINNSDFTEEEVVDVVKKELEHRYQTMSKIFSPIPIFLLHIYKFARLFVCQSAVYLLLLTKSYCLRMEVYSVSVNQ